MFQYSLFWFISSTIIVVQWHSCSGIRSREIDRNIDLGSPGLIEWIKNTGDSLPSLPYLSLATLLKCFALDNVIDTVESYMTAGLLKGGSLAAVELISYFDIIHHGVDEGLKEGLVWNGQFVCKQYWYNATVAQKDCLLNGEQSFLDDELANGYQTILCGELSNNFVQFLNGYIKMYMSNSLDVPFNGSIDFGRLGKADGSLSNCGIRMKLPDMKEIRLQFNQSTGCN